MNADEPVSGDQRTETAGTHEKARPRQWHAANPAFSRKHTEYRRPRPGSILRYAMLDLPLRILLVLALVTWSPAWCCCALHAAVNGEAAQHGEVAGAFCQGRWGGGMDASREAAPDLPPCCMARAVAEAQEAVHETIDSGCCDNEDSPCNCGDRPDELTRLDTSGKVTMPVPQRIAMAIITIHPGEGDRAPLFTAWSHAQDHLTHAPSRTLLALGCLLLI